MEQDAPAQQPKRPGPDRPAYPRELKCNEQALLKKRHGYTGRKGPERIGFGLSGGGIRSATFCLGVFQALGNLGLLKDIDYISSVSGGSYFASFYGRLFTRGG
jgi:predicted acylesterase/phospholipase RssA